MVSDGDVWSAAAAGTTPPTRTTATAHPSNMLERIGAIFN